MRRLPRDRQTMAYRTLVPWLRVENHGLSAGQNLGKWARMLGLASLKLTANLKDDAVLGSKLLPKFLDLCYRPALFPKNELAVAPFLADLCALFIDCLGRNGVSTAKDVDGMARSAVPVPPLGRGFRQKMSMKSVFSYPIVALVGPCKIRTRDQMVYSPVEREKILSRLTSPSPATWN